MRPSEYMSRGIRMRPKQAFGKLFDDGGAASCAIAALVEGFTGRFILEERDFWFDAVAALSKEMPWLLGNFVRCPYDACGHVKGVWSMAVHLNNIHMLSREEIGEWLDRQQVILSQYWIQPSPAQTVEQELELVEV